MTRNSFASFVRVVALFGVIWMLVLLINSPVISFDMMYEEQPIIYLVNQKITSLHDLLQVYLHPAVLEPYTIPFFRPTGHFLLYQIITSFLDWHNTKGFLIVSFFFLALSCLLIIKLYELLFPRYHSGGYIACGIYLMHPALAMSRLTPMHFEFANVAFTLLGLYCFALFWQKNFNLQQKPGKIQLGMLALTILFFAISVTIKETSLMLGPVLAVYLFVASFRGQSLKGYLSAALGNKNFLQILLILTCVTLALVTYLSMAWQGFFHPSLSAAALDRSKVFIHLWQIVFGFWTNVLFPAPVQSILRMFLVSLLVSGILLYFVRRDAEKTLLLTYQKSFLFLLLAAILFMILPVLWGREKPWHLALSLVFINLLAGFSLEYLGHVLSRNKALINKTGIAITTSLGLAAFYIALNHAHYFAIDDALRIDRNAVLHAPDIKQQLNAASIVVVEDSFLRDSYLLGDSIYPQDPLGVNFQIQRLMSTQGFYLPPEIYGGTLFKWAYKLPALNELVYPFEISKMASVPSWEIYNWLQHFNNIFCLGYDRAGLWYDRTIAFKHNLLIEQSQRHLQVNRYKITTARTYPASSTAWVHLPNSDASYCQFRCDSNKNCTGFTYVLTGKNAKAAQCYFHPTTAVAKQTCDSCQEFVKV